MNNQEVNDFYIYLQSEQTAQRFLLQCYRSIEVDNPEKKSYTNSHAFIYYLEHGNKFLSSGKPLNMVVKPVLFFYGIVHLLKAVLITKRPDYPETTKVLAHGVSARKRKKKQYTFLEDEVTVHHNGLFPYFSKHLFSISNSPREKYKMISLLSLIPEMNHLFKFYKYEKMIIIGKINANKLQFPLHLLDTYFLTERAFLKRIKTYLPTSKYLKTCQNYLHIKLNEPLKMSFGPFFFNYSDQMIYFPIHRDDLLPISEIMIHYLLLYNLSMICRYETEWWGNLLGTKPNVDYPFITHFLNNTAMKTSLLIGQEIYDIYSTIFK